MRSPSAKLRVSFIEYLNSVPLGWSFLHGSDRGVFEVFFDVPSQCARRLASGEADVGLIPVIEYQRIPELRVLPGISIASRREVKSVLFVSKKPLPELSTVAVDESSRTSVALLKILLRKFHGIDSVSYHPQRPDSGKMLERHDAALLIGNPALEVPRGLYRVYDLAQEWNRFTGLPFVFAFWAVRNRVDLGQQIGVFYRSRKEGLEEVEAISRIYSRKLGVPAAEIRTYILENLNYSLDEPNLEGLRLFFKTAAELELIPSLQPLRFYPVSQL